MFSSATAPVILPIFLLWLLLGFILHRISVKQLAFVGYGGIITLLVCTFGLFGHAELALMIWMFYLALLTIYFLFARNKIETRFRKLNLIFHGSFLILVLVGGIIAKVMFWSHRGFDAWLGWMQEIGSGYYIFFTIIATLTILYFHRFVAKKIDKQ